MVTGHKRGGLLKLDDLIDPSDPSRVVHDVLLENHPPAQPLFLECLFNSVSEPPSVHPMAVIQNYAKPYKCRILSTVSSLLEIAVPFEIELPFA